MKKLTKYALAAGIGFGVGCAVYYLNKHYFSYTISVEKNDDCSWIPSIKITKEDETDLFADMEPDTAPVAGTKPDTAPAEAAAPTEEVTPAEEVEKQPAAEEEAAEAADD